jgi:hypothetical protein
MPLEERKRRDIGSFTADKGFWDSTIQLLDVVRCQRAHVCFLFKAIVLEAFGDSGTNHLPSNTFLLFTNRCLGRIRPWSVGFSLLDMDPSLTALHAEKSHDLLASPIHDHGVWDAFPLEMER